MELELYLESYNESYYVLWDDNNNNDFPTEEQIYECFIDNCDIVEEDANGYVIEENDYAVASYYNYDNCIILRKY